MNNTRIMKIREMIVFCLLAPFFVGGFAVMAQDSSRFNLFDHEENTTPAYDLSFTAGTSFSSFSGAGGMLTNRIAPRLGLDMGKDFHLEIGTIFSSSRISGMPVGLTPSGALNGSGNVFQQADGHLFSSTVYALGAYQVSPRLSIHGATWFEQNTLDMQNSPVMNPQAVRQNPQGMMLGFDYQVTENFRFGAEVNVSSGYNPFAPMHNQQSPFGGLYHQSPFHRPERW